MAEDFVPLPAETLSLSAGALVLLIATSRRRAQASFIAWDRLLVFVAEGICLLRGIAGPSPLRGSTFRFTIPFEPRVVMEGSSAALPGPSPSLALEVLVVLARTKFFPVLGMVRMVLNVEN